MEKMKWTYEKVRRYVEVQRRRARRGGCLRRICGRHVVTLELAGSPSLSRMVRDGYGIERIKEAMKTRGWFCRGCARGYTIKERETELREWKKKQQQLQCPEPVSKRNWPEDAKWDYVYSKGQRRDRTTGKAREVFEGAELDEALRIIREAT